MNQSQRLNFINAKTTQDVDELWQNCFEGKSNIGHINRHAPHKITQFGVLKGSLQQKNPQNSWVIRRRAENDIIGFIIYGDFFPNRPDSVGFSIGLNYSRNGYATEALKALIEHLRNKGFQEVFGYCYSSNIGSIKTMEKCGFADLGPTGNTYGENSELKFRLEL